MAHAMFKRLLSASIASVRAWRNMLRHFGKTPDELPLLEFDPNDWDAPFTDISAQHSRGG